MVVRGSPNPCLSYWIPPVYFFTRVIHYEYDKRLIGLRMDRGERLYFGFAIGFGVCYACSQGWMVEK
jgi:hypothetical protein